MFYRIWREFTNSKWFLALRVLLAVLLSLAGIYTLLNLSYMIYAWCVDKPKIVKTVNKITVPLYIDGNTVNCNLTTTGGTVDVEVLVDENITYEVLPDIIENVVKREQGPDYVVGEIRYVYDQSYPEGQKKLNKTGKTTAKKPIQLIQNTQPKEQALISDAQQAIINRVYKSAAWVKGTRSSCYGFRLKDLDVLTPAHIWNHSGEQGTINVAQQGVVLTVPCMVTFVDHGNDIALIRIRDNSGRGGRCTIERSADMTKYFIEERNLNILRHGVLLARQIGSAERPFRFADALPMAMAGYISAKSQNATTDTDKGERQVCFYRAQLLDIMTKAGDCGTVYMSLDNAVSSKCIVGLHSSVMPGYKESMGSIITQEYLARIEAMATIGKQQQGVTLGTQKDLTVVDPIKMEWYPPNTTLFADSYGMTDTYVEWHDALEEVYIEDGDVWYDADNNPAANVNAIGYDKKASRPRYKVSHVRTPWSKAIEAEMPVTKWLSLTDACQHSDPASLKTIGGKPSLLGTQINKYNDPAPTHPDFDKYLEKATACLYSECKKQYSGGLRVLTDTEVINGTYLNPRDPLYGGLEPLDMDSSAGDYPSRKWGVTTKEPLFRKLPYTSISGRTLYTWDNSIKAMDVYHSVLNVEYYAEQGVRVLIPVKDCLKAELNEKKDKSRLFSCMSLEETLLGRKYVGALQARCMQEHTKSHTQIGINPFPGMHTLYRRLTEKSLYGESGDVAGWDKHILAKLLKAAFDTAKKLMIEENPHLSKELNNVYNILADQCVNAMCIADGVVYFKNRGMLSGCPVTTMINSWVNDILEYMAVMWLIDEHNKDRVKMSQNDYDNKYHPIGSPIEHLRGTRHMFIRFTLEWMLDHFDWATFGDDFIQAIDVKLLWLVNFMARKRFFTNLVGLDYTPPNKGDKAYWYDKIENQQFISRTFRQEAGLTFAALKKPSIESLLHYCRTPCNKQFEDNIRNALHESVAWGEEYYNKICTVVWKIVRWSREKHTEINVSVSPWNIAVENLIGIITQSHVSVYPEPSEGDTEKCRVNPENGFSTFALANDTESLETEINAIAKRIQETDLKDLKAQAEMQGLKHPRHDYLAITRNVYFTLKEFEFSQCKELKGLASWPAYVETREGGYVSICFDGVNCKRYDYVQSDLSYYIDDLLPDFRQGKITLCFRSLNHGGSLTPVWQVQYNVAFSRPPATKASKNLQASCLCPKTRFAQATGTAAKTPIQDGREGPVDETDINVYATKGVPMSSIQTSIWRHDMKKLAFTPMETMDSPIDIKIATPAHTVVFKRPLNMLNNMPPAMRKWADLHSSTNAVRKISLKFISAATLVNELVVGIAAQAKSTYSIHELQLIEWHALNPQDVTATIRLSLSNVDWGRGIGGQSIKFNDMVNRYAFVNYTGTAGQDNDPYDIPTLVMMTRVGIQNSYANPDVSIQIAVTECFEHGDFLVDAQKLKEGVNIEGLSSTIATPLSSYLNMEPGTPLNITCDGGLVTVITQPNTEKNTLNMQHTSVISSHGEWTAKPNTQEAPRCYARIMLRTDTTSVWLPILPHTTFDLKEKDRTTTYEGWNFVPYQRQTALWPEDVAQQAKAMLPLLRNNNEYPFNPIVKASVMAAPYVFIVTSMNDANIRLTIPDAIVGRENTSVAHEDCLYAFQERTIRDILEAMVGEFFQYEDRVVTMVPENIVTIEFAKTDMEFLDRQVSLNATTSFEFKPAEPYPLQFTTNVNHVSSVVEYTDPITGDLVRALATVARNFVNPEEGKRTFVISSWNATMSGYYRDVEQTNFIFPRWGGEGQLTYRILTPMEQIVGVVDTVTRSEQFSLDSNMSKLSFPLTTPKTLSRSLALSHTPVEFDNTDFIQALTRKFRSEGISYTNDNLIIFNITSIVGGSIAIVVIYDPQYKTFFVHNSPSQPEDYYKTFRKLTYEDVGISQIRVVAKASAALPLTHTENWINRVTGDKSDEVFTGRTLISEKSIQANGKLLTHFKRRRAQAAEMAMAAAGGFASQVFGSIMQYLASKNLLDQKIQGDLQKMQVQFENQEKLQNQLFEQKLRFAGLQAQAYRSSYPGLGSGMTAQNNTAVPPPSDYTANSNFNNYSWRTDDNDKPIMPTTTGNSASEQQQEVPEVAKTISPETTIPSSASPTAMGNGVAMAQQKIPVKFFSKGPDGTLNPYIDSLKNEQAIMGSKSSPQRRSNFFQAQPAEPFQATSLHHSMVFTRSKGLPK